MQVSDGSGRPIGRVDDPCALCVMDQTIKDAVDAALGQRVSNQVQQRQNNNNASEDAAERAAAEAVAAARRAA